MELVSTARNAVPSGAKVGLMTARDGKKLRYALWDTTAPERLGTVCVFGGRGEFIEKYFETITDLRRRGFSIATMDWRSQGGSERLLKDPFKCHAEDFANSDADLRQFMTEIVLPDCGAPYYGLAHSMGGHIVLRSAQTRGCWFDGIILSSPMIAFKRTFPGMRLCSEVACLAGFGDAYVPGGDGNVWREPFENNEVTSDPLRYQRCRDVLDKAPELAVGSPTIGWIAAALKSIGELDALSLNNGVRVPVLIVASGNDEVVSLRSTEIFTSRLKNCAHIVVAGAKHEILQERDELRDQFWAAFDAYIPGSYRAKAERGIGLSRER
jgi:lysophospholipase